MENKRNVKGLVFEVVLLILGLILLVGAKFIFHACEAMDNGMYMNCHKAENTAAIFGGAIAVLSLVLIFVRPRIVKNIIAAVIAVGSVVSAVIPNNIIKLCMMADMQCRAVMRPAVIVLGIITAAVAVLYIVLNRKEA